jgi:hypothetical protein
MRFKANWGGVGALLIQSVRGCSLVSPQLKWNYKIVNYECLMELIQNGQLPVEIRVGNPKTIRRTPAVAQISMEMLEQMAQKIVNHLQVKPRLITGNGGARFLRISWKE